MLVNGTVRILFKTRLTFPCINGPIIQVHNYFTKCTVRLYDSLCQPGIYLSRKMKVEHDPGLVLDKFSEDTSVSKV